MKLEFGTLNVTIGLSPTLESWVKAQASSNNATLSRIEGKLDAQNVILGKIMTNEELALAALKKIDDATTSIGTSLTAVGNNVTTIGTVATTINTEVDALVAAMNTAGVPQAILDMATGIGAKATAISDAATLTAAATSALVPVLNNIAAKGVINVVPVPVPPPPAPVAVP